MFRVSRRAAAFSPDPVEETASRAGTRETPSDARSGPSRPVHWVSHWRRVGVLVALAAMVLASSVGPASGTFVAAASALGAHITPAHSTPASVPAVASPTGLAGQSPVGESPGNPAAQGQLIHQNLGQPVLPLTSSEPITAFPVPASPSAPSGSAAAGAVVSSGYVTGTVVDSLPPHTPLSGVQVTANPLAGFCPSQGCLPVETDPNGVFKVLAAAGENVLLFSDPYYLSNRTWAYVSTDGLISVGTVELVHDGYITGVVLGDDPVHNPLGGIRITAQTRDGTFEALPEAHTDSTGTFVAAVPPVPSVVTFTSLFPFSPYESNHTWVNVSAGATLNIGTVYLEKMTVISITLTDATNGRPIVNAGSIQVVSRDTQYQPAQGAIMYGPTLLAQAPPGPDTAVVYAAGYLVDTVTLGVVPTSAPGATPTNMGSFAMVPLGTIVMNAGVMGENLPSVARAESIWQIGQAVIRACSLDDESTAALTPSNNLSATDCTGGCDPYVGQYVQFGALPLRNYVTVVPDTGGACGFTPTWPIPGYLPVFENYAWANVTPDLTVDIGMVNMLPGTYVEGTVLPSTQTGWDVIGCSTDETNLCAPGVLSDQAYQNDYVNTVPTGCVQPGSPNADITFCAPVPPGPSKIRIVPNNASMNYTWIDTKLYDYSNMPEPMAMASAAGVQSLNLSAGEVSGRVLQARSLTPVGGLPAITACPAGLSPGSVQCGNGVAAPSGYFNISAPFGWVRVTVSATEYVANSTWVYVRSHNQSGTILLTPYSFINGQVVNSAGVGIRDAVVEDCPVTNPAGCSPLGADGGVTSTNGYYFGTAASGALPRGAYEVEAMAPGFQSDWTWVNVTTPGENFTAPTIVLQSLPTPPAGVARAAGSGNVTAYGSWVLGRIIDGVDGIGLPVASVSAVPVIGGNSLSLSSVRGTGGEFNDTLPDGDYVLAVNLAGFYSNSVGFNVTGNSSTIDLGTIALQPFPTVVGRVVIDPWRVGASERLGLGPGVAQVTVCSDLSSLCGPGTPADTSGYFNVSAPAGTYDVIYAQGTGSGTGTFTAGFIQNQTFLNVTNGTAQTGPPVVIGLSIFGTIVGSVVENGTGGGVPVAFDSILADTFLPIDATQGETLNATGNYTIFFPTSVILNMTAGGLGAYISQGRSFTLTGTLDPNQPPVLPAGGLADLNVIAGGPSFSLVHFGWIDARMIDSNGGAPVPFATMSVTEPGTLWGLATAYTASGSANGYGFINLTAPPSLPSTAQLQVNITSPDYSFNTTHVYVNSSETTYLNGTGPNSLRGFGLKSWGWVVGTVTDALTGAPLNQVVPVATGPGSITGTTGAVTNGAGYFRIDAPPSTTDHLTITTSGYQENASYQNVGYGRTVSIAPVHLIGNGVVQGQVVSYPAFAPVSGATVSVCPRSQPSCSDQVTTNVTGIFVVTARPGTDIVTVTAQGFVTNTPQFVTVTSDTWTEVGQVVIYEYAFVTGYTLGIPSGAPLANANASLCALPLSGTGAGPCFVTTVTGSDGSFRAEAPAGTYVLDANATFYNDTYLTVSLSPGEVLPVGTLYLSEFGTATGSVRSADGGLPLPGAQILACEAWALQICRPLVTAGVDAQFAFTGPPGPYSVEATATGYQAGYEHATLRTGGTTPLPVFSLIPIGPGNSYPVSGVVLNANGSLPLAGAVVTATGGFSATVSSDGSFSMVLPWGSYTLKAWLSGYLASSQTVAVYGTVTGLHFALALATFSVSGVVRDGLTQVGVGGVAIVTAQGAVLGSNSGATGTYSFSLPNGTYALVARPPATAALYASVSFNVVVNGAPVVRDLALYPTPVYLDGLVVNALTGLSIPGATITLSGTTHTGVAWSTAATSGPDGRFVIPAYSGSYTLMAQAAGYRSGGLSLDISYSPSEPSQAVSVPLTPLTASAPPTGLGLSGTLWVVAGVGGAAAVGALLWVFSRPRVPAKNLRTK